MVAGSLGTVLSVTHEHLLTSRADAAVHLRGWEEGEEGGGRERGKENRFS